MSVKTARARYVAAASVAVLVGAGLLSRSATAFNPQPDPPRFGMVGIVDSQTARLNLVNLGIPTPDGLPPGPCRAHLKFFDGEGNLLASQRVDLKPGQAAFLDFAPSFNPPVNDTNSGPQRAEIRGAIVPIDGAYAPPCKATVEIFDNATGRSSIFIPPGPCRGAACLGQP
jgi:hypothetical protein